MSYGSDAKSSSQLWESDHAGDFDNANANNGKNTGLLKRVALTKSSKTIDLEGPIMHELFQMDRFILNQVGISLKLYRTRPEFRLMSTTTTGKTYNIKLEEVICRVCKCNINPAVILGHANMFRKDYCQIPIQNSVAKMYY